MTTGRERRPVKWPCAVAVACNEDVASDACREGELTVELGHCFDAIVAEAFEERRCVEQPSAQSRISEEHDPVLTRAGAAHVSGADVGALWADARRPPSNDGTRRHPFGDTLGCVRARDVAANEPHH